MKFTYLLAPLLLLVSSQAFCSPELTGNLATAQALIPAKCTIVSGSGISFGTYLSQSTNRTNHKDAETSITLRCTSGTTGAHIYINAGQHAQAQCTEAPTRMMKNTTQALYHLRYDLFQDSARSTLWGCEAENSQILPEFTSSTQSLVVPIYGRIPSGQHSRPGAHSDTVSISVTF